MKAELELTIQLTKPIAEVQKLLEQAKCEFVEESVLDDIYMKPMDKYNTIEDLLNHSILIRQEGTRFKGFTLKKKEYKENGAIVQDQKLYLEVPNLEQGKLFLELIGYQELCHIKQKMYIYKRKKSKIFIQIVEGLGNYLEYEGSKEETEEIIKETLQTMLHQTFSNYYEKKAIAYIEKYHLFVRE